MLVTRRTQTPSRLSALLMLAFTLLLLVLLPSDGPRWILSELAPSDGRRIEIEGDLIPLPADLDGDGAHELLLAEPPIDERAGRLRIVSPITGETIVEHAIQVE